MMNERSKFSTKNKGRSRNSILNTYHSLIKTIISCTLVLFASYILASTVGSMMVPMLMSSIKRINLTKLRPPTQRIRLTGRPNFHTAKKEILERNLFNLEGELPDESEQVETSSIDRRLEDFDDSAPCLPSQLKLTLIGTIFLGDPKNSMASIRESGFDEADIYRAGESILGIEDVTIVRIERNRVTLNNSGNKECLEIKLAEDGRGSIFSDSSFSDRAKGQSEDSTVTLQAAFVESELGDGFGKIIQSARLVPNTINNRVNGFKIFAITKGSLLDKIGFKNGDVITQVNDTLMDAKQGFALYQSLLDDPDVTIRVLRAGKTPKTLRVRIK